MPNPIRFDPKRKRSQWSLSKGKRKRFDARGVDPRALRIAYFRLETLKALRSEISKKDPSQTKTQVVADFVQFLRSGFILADTSARAVSRSSLYGWKKKYETGGLAALIPRLGYKPIVGKDNLAFVKLFPSYKKITIPGSPRSRNGKGSLWPSSQNNGRRRLLILR